MFITVTQDLEERARLMKLRIKLQQDSGLGPIPHSHRHEYESYGSRGIRSGDYLDHHDRPMSHERDRMERSRDRGYDRGRDLERGHRARRNKGPFRLVPKIIVLAIKDNMLFT